MRSRLVASLARTFSSLRTSRNFRLYLSGQFVSAVGTWMNFTASSWLVLSLTGSGTVNGVVQSGQVMNPSNGKPAYDDMSGPRVSLSIRFVH